MAGTITHEWTGTILTIHSDAGSSSMDLKGAKGDMGVRGAQGIPGILYSEHNYATMDYVDNAIDNIEIDTSAFATKSELNSLVPTVVDDVLAMANICYVATAAPTADVGKDGDIFIVKG